MYNDDSTLMDETPPVAQNKPPTAFIRLFRHAERLDLGRTAIKALRQVKKAAVHTYQPIEKTFRRDGGYTSSMTTGEQTGEALRSAVDRSNEVLASAKTVFPFKLFTDEITLDRTKVTVTRRNFFFASDVMSIRIEDILNVSASLVPFFGSITIATRVLSSDDHFMLTRFWRKDAAHLKHMIQGYVIARHNNIICDHLEKEELVKTLAQLGKDSNLDRYVKNVPSRIQPSRF